MGIGFDDALRRLGRLHAVAGRRQRFGGGTAPLVVVDYAHTPDALEQALTALRAHSRGCLWCVFGCGGDRDRGKRPLMGAAAARLADRIVVTDDNPRSEDPSHITEEIMAGIGDNTNVSVIHDRAAALAHALTQATAAGVVLIAGKGQETNQQIGTQFLPFSAQAVVQRLLSGGRPCTACVSVQPRRPWAVCYTVLMPSSRRSASTVVACEWATCTSRSKASGTTATASFPMRRRRARWPQS